MSNHAGDTCAALLEGSETHVWSVSPNAVFHSENDPSQCLSGDERERVLLQRHEVPRLRFIAVRTALRHILSRYISARPGDVPIRRQPSGKLVLDGHPDVHFSLTHTGPIALIAVAAAAVGIDAEHIRMPAHLEKTARRILHEDTVRTLASLPPEEKASAFIAAWTLREAHVKAVGGGLFRTPDTLPFDSAITADGALHHVDDRAGSERWSIARFAPSHASLAALVVRGHIQHLRFFDSPVHNNEEIT